MAYIVRYMKVRRVNKNKTIFVANLSGTAELIRLKYNILEAFFMHLKVLTLSELHDESLPTMATTNGI